MATKSNKEILNAIRNEASAEYKEKVPEVRSREDEATVYSKVSTYPSIKNEFVGLLTNNIFKKVVMNKVWNNPLAMLKKGEIPYGQGIEHLFIDLAHKKNFWDNFNDKKFGDSSGSPTDASSLLGKETADVHNQFIQRNFAYKYKASLSNQRLRAAFETPNGLASFIDGQIASVMTTANYYEFQDMIGVLNRNTESGTGHQNGNGTDKGMPHRENGIIYQIANLDLGSSQGTNTSDMLYKVPKLKGDGTTEKQLVEAIRTVASEMSFLSKKYNLAGVNTACLPEELVLFTTSDVIAKLDVHVLSAAFNVSEAEVNVRVIKVPIGTFTKISGKKWGRNSGNEAQITPIAVLCDKEAIQQYDTLIDSGSFYNPDTLMTNMFVHRQGITASCGFAQTVVFGHVE